MCHVFFFFKQKTAYEMRISDWSSYVCSSDLSARLPPPSRFLHPVRRRPDRLMAGIQDVEIFTDGACKGNPGPGGWGAILRQGDRELELSGGAPLTTNNRMEMTAAISSEEHTSELQSIMRISYAAFCLKKK